MRPTACIDLRNFPLRTHIGSYGPGQTVPDQHLLDLTLSIDADWVLIEADGMEHVFDYDPLVLEIERLAQDGPYETQERLITRIVQACAQVPAIQALELALRKQPIREVGGSSGGSLGVRLAVSAAQLQSMRTSKPEGAAG